jgi:hypothetical protein
LGGGCLVACFVCHGTVGEGLDGVAVLYGVHCVLGACGWVRRADEQLWICWQELLDRVSMCNKM